jgi:hypothetical protein
MDACLELGLPPLKLIPAHGSRTIPVEQRQIREAVVGESTNTQHKPLTQSHHSHEPASKSSSLENTLLADWPTTSDAHYCCSHPRAHTALSARAAQQSLRSEEGGNERGFRSLRWVGGTTEREGAGQIPDICPSKLSCQRTSSVRDSWNLLCSRGAMAQLITLHTASLPSLHAHHLIINPSPDVAGATVWSGVGYKCLKPRTTLARKSFLQLTLLITLLSTPTRPMRSAAYRTTLSPTSVDWCGCNEHGLVVTDSCL